MRSVAHQQHFKLVNAVDQELPKATGQHVLCVLVAPQTNAGHQDLALESSVDLIVGVSGFLPVMLDFDIGLTGAGWTVWFSF